ncbi:MAG: hypothetical protein KBH82_06400 [Syntrophorhabdaceae bacterium]|nr:hypothetical protein [Syntrophorhabdaceae bacterium]
MTPCGFPLKACGNDSGGGACGNDSGGEHAGMTVVVVHARVPPFSVTPGRIAWPCRCRDIP